MAASGCQYVTDSPPNSRGRILVLTHYYAPGFRAGGPIQSVGNIVRYLGREYDFFVVTLDRDLGSTEPHAGIRPNRWQRHEGAEVFYVRQSPFSWLTIARLIFSVRCDLVYLNSFFNPLFSIWPLILLRIGMLLGMRRTPILLAPRGEFSAGALQIHATRKSWFMFLSDLFRLHRTVMWHASSEFEATDITATVGKTIVKIGSPIAEQRIITASDLVATPAMDAARRAPVAERPKNRDEATIGFISRISPMKNLEFALEVLAGVRGKVAFEIYGPAEDRGYLKRCQRLIENLPPNVVARVHGELPHAEVDEVLRSVHLLLLPTRGENFGHIINEALIAGTPVLISNLTPWRDLAGHGAGWDLPIDDPAPFRAVIEKIVAMDAAELLVHSRAAQNFARHRPRENNALEQNRRMFEDCLRSVS
jgi:glycosyltransferase involved in cell wall biosynthesis